MKSSLYLALVLALVMVSFSCSVLDNIGGRHLSAQYCADHPEDVDCHGGQPDGGDTTCKSNADCEAPSAVCDLAGSKMCVQCVAPDDVAACSGTSPVCRDDHACHACAAHSDCSTSDTCLPDGSCALETDVAYVDPVRGAGNACSHDAPCKKVADALAVSRPYLKLTGMIDEQVQINQDVTVLADPNAVLTTTKNGVLVELRGSSKVSIYDLTITGASGSSGIGVSIPAGNPATLTLDRCTISSNVGGGVVASNGTVTITSSTISGNTAGGIMTTNGSLAISRSVINGNVGGGISLSSTQFDISNSFIVSNGGISTPFGGADFDKITNGKFEFNTVSNNTGADGATVGVVCSLISQPLTFANNIVYANRTGGTGTQVGGANCNWQYSDIGPTTAAGTGNINVDPLFVDTLHGNFHLQPTSGAKDKADPGSTEPLDFDGDPRPQSNARDMGADEIKP